MLNYLKKLVNYANNIPFRCYVNEENEHIKPQDIPEYILIQTGEISRNNTVTIFLDRYGTPLEPKSIYVSGQSERDEKIDVEIWNTTPQPEQKVFVTNLDPKDLPFIFPPIVLFPFNYIKLKPRTDVVNCLLLFKPAIVIDHYNLQEDNQ